jgi:hypothetical protein
MKSEEQFFHEVKKEKLASSAASLRSKRDSVWGTPSIYEGSRPNCEFRLNTRVNILLTFHCST